MSVRSFSSRRVSHSDDAALVVIHLLGSLQRGGTEIRTLEALRVLKDTGAPLETHLVLLSGDLGPLEPDAQDLGIHLHPLRLNWQFPYRFVLLLRRLDPDCVHSHVHLASGPLLLLSRLAGVPRRIGHFRSSGDGARLTKMRKLRNSAFRRMVRWAATDVLAGTSSVLDAVWGSTWRGDRRFKVVGQGVDVEGLRAALMKRGDSELIARTLIQVGRIDPEKNQLLTLESFRVATQRRPDIRLVLAGRPIEPYATRVREWIASSGLNNIDMLGERGDIAELLASASVLVHPTLREGWPGVIVEARASGMRILASDIAPIAELSEGIGGVDVLGVSCGAEQWASEMLRLLDAAPDLSERTSSATAMVGTSEDVKVAALSLLRVWAGC